jgi:hypothetical protein
MESEAVKTRTAYMRYCPNLLRQKVWCADKGKRIICPRCGTKAKGVDIKN